MAPAPPGDGRVVNAEGPDEHDQLARTLAGVLLRGGIPARRSLEALRPHAWQVPLRTRVVAASWLVEGRVPEAARWAERATSLKPSAGAWRLRVAVADAQANRDALVRALAELAALGDAAAAGALAALRADPRLERLPEPHRPLLHPASWFPEYASEAAPRPPPVDRPPPPAAPPSTVAPLDRAPPPPPPPAAAPGLTRLLLDADVVDLVESCAEALRHRSTSAPDLLAELFEKLEPRIPGALGQPRAVIRWVNERVDEHLLVPEDLLALARARLARRRAAATASARARPPSPPAPAPPPPDRPPAPAAGPPPPRTEATRTLTTGSPAGTATTVTLGPSAARPAPAGASPRIAHLADLQPGAELAGYTLVARAGQGGMGTVWKAVRDGRTYAIKTIRAPKASHVEALRRELELLEQVRRSDYFPRVHEHFEQERQLFVVMDWVDGRTLHAWVTAQRLQDLHDGTFRHLMRQIAHRLRYLHTFPGGGLLFRDLKPSNVMVGADLAVRLVDFGISHRAGEAVLAGSHGYLAPEVQLRGTASVRTDVFSLGRVGLFLLFGHERFDEIREQLPPFGFDRGLRASIVAACLGLADPEPQRRPADCLEAWTILRRALEPEAAAAPRRGGVACATCGSRRPRHARVCPACGATAAPRSASEPSAAARVEPLKALDVADREAFEAYEELLLARAASDITELRCLPQIQVQPYEYQKDAAVQVLARLRGRALIADDVGLGKTIEAGLVIKEQLVRSFARRVLIVSPPGVLLEQLRVEMAEKFGLAFRQFVTSPGGPHTVGPRELASADLVITSKAYLSRGNEPLLESEWDTVVVDECHHFTNPSSNQWQNLRRLTARATSVLLLSATPFGGKPEQLWALFSILRPGWFGQDVGEYRRQHLHRDWTGAQRPSEAFREELGRLTIRRRRGQIGGGIRFPGRDAVRVGVSLTPEEAALHREITRAIRALDPRHQVQAHRQLASSYESLRESAVAQRLAPEVRARLQRLTDADHPKARALLDRVLPRLPGGEKVLLFSHFRASQKALVRLLGERGMGALGLVDQTPRERVQVVQRFREDPHARVLVCGEGAGEGLNLQFCSILVNFDLPWNPMRLEQRIGRVQRLGQRRERVTVVNLVIRDAIEDRVLEILTERLAMFELFMGETEQVLGRALEDEEDGDAFERWLARLVLENGGIDLEGLERLGARLDRARAEVEADRERADEVERWLPSSAAPAEAATAPAERAIDLSFLEDES